MKLVTYSVDGNGPRVGSLEGEEIRPLAHEDMIELIEYGGSPEPAEDTVPLGEARIHAPIARPQKVIGIGLNYEDHAAETGADIPEKPIVFAKYPNTVIGPGEAIRIPPITEQADYEAELVAFLSQGMTLVPGDVIVTGTPPGVGSARDPQVWLKAGDEVTIEIQGLGTLTNPVETA